MNFKRITILSGHYGSGKTNIAVNLARELRQQKPRVAIADIDIVNPYFRTKDSEALLQKEDIRLICSPYANSNVDIPALPQEMYSVTDDRELYSIVDVGGDERGALALGRLSPKIAEEANYDMLLVVNCYRPLTRTAATTVEVMREIENACRLKFSGIINNSNLGRETAPEDVEHSMAYAGELCRQTGLPLLFTTVARELYEPLKNKIPHLYPLELQKKL
ncbi:MAG: hypothetical protein IKI29_06830 [Clostridia bacterium]|nr:hypothetical protein [Clostridia bacterium]